MSRIPRFLTALLIQIFFVLCISGQTTAEGPTESTRALVTAMVERLLLMEAVAQYKWNKGMPIENLAREHEVLNKVVASAKAHGLAVDLAWDFFRAQIAAAKAIQSRLFDTWRQGGVSSFPSAPDLKTQSRPAISPTSATRGSRRC